jgi:hypothetical protein
VRAYNNVVAEHRVAQAFLSWTAITNPLRGLQGMEFLDNAEVITADCKSIDKTWFLSMQLINPLRSYNDVAAEHIIAHAFQFELMRQRLQ